MARKARPVQYDYVDDLDGKVLPEDTETTKFTLGGTRYEIDLSPANAKKLDKARAEIQTFLDAARAVGATPGRRAGSPAAPSRASKAEKDHTQAVRSWAQGPGKSAVEAAGLKVPGDRGRIAEGVVELFNSSS